MRTSGNGNSYTSSRRKARIMSDDEDMTIDEANQVRTHLIMLIVLLFILFSHLMVVLTMMMKELVVQIHVKNDCIFVFHSLKFCQFPFFCHCMCVLALL